MTGSDQGYVDCFTESALAGSTHEAVNYALGLLDRGIPENHIIAEVLAPVQRQIGEQWQQGLASVADEHIVSGVTESALYALSSASPPGDQLGSVVVASAEGDWHSIASHMIAEQLRGRGVFTAFLGASTPTEDVVRFLHNHRPDALVVSCALTLFFPGVSRLAAAAHQEGVPVIAGGRAFLGRPEVAQRIGVDAHADDVAVVVDLLARWRSEPPTISDSTTPRPDASRLDLEAGRYAEIAMKDLRSRFPAMARYSPHQLDRTVEDLRYIVRFAAASLFVDDPSVFAEFLVWLVDLLTARNVPKEAVIAGLESLQTIPDVRESRAGALFAQELLLLA